MGLAADEVLLRVFQSLTLVVKTVALTRSRISPELEGGGEVLLVVWRTACIIVGGTVSAALTTMRMRNPRTMMLMEPLLMEGLLSQMTAALVGGVRPLHMLAVEEAEQVEDWKEEMTEVWMVRDTLNEEVGREQCDDRPLRTNSVEVNPTRRLLPLLQSLEGEIAFIQKRAVAMIEQKQSWMIPSLELQQFTEQERVCGDSSTLEGAARLVAQTLFQLQHFPSQVVA